MESGDDGSEELISSLSEEEFPIMSYAAYAKMSKGGVHMKKKIVLRTSGSSDSDEDDHFRATKKRRLNDGVGITPVNNPREPLTPRTESSHQKG